MKQDGDKCSDTRKSHNDIFKSYVYIARVLTDVYASVAKAHAAQYKDDMDFNRTLGKKKSFLLLTTVFYFIFIILFFVIHLLIDADTIKGSYAELVDDYIDDIHALISETNSTLESVSRHIENYCPKKLLEDVEFRSCRYKQIVKDG